MTANSPTAYPAEYYYPEFIESRPDDPRKLPASSYLPLTTSIDNGVGSTTKPQTNINNTNETSTIKKQPATKKQKSNSLALDIVTDQGLPDADLTKSVTTDPKRNLVRNPVEKNIPRLIVDGDVIKQAVRTPKIVTNDLENDSAQTKKNNQMDNNDKKTIPNGNTNGDLKNKTKFSELSADKLKQLKQQQQQQNQRVQGAEDEQAVDDYWKKELFIDEEGAVTIEPLKYDKNTYNGPFGLTRKGSFIFYIGMGIFTILAAVFLIMCGIFYSQSYPSDSSKTGLLTGIGICGFAFYLGLLLILIGLWHQKYRQENPKRVMTKQTKANDSTAHLKTSMEENEPYDYSLNQPYDYSQNQPYDYSQNQPYVDYTPYGNYGNSSYVSNGNEQMLLQQPGAATGAGFYEPVAWPSNVEIQTQPDPRFYQPIEWSYGLQPTNTAAAQYAYQPETTNDSKLKTKSQTKGATKTVSADPPKAKLDNIFPNSTVVEAPLPSLNKAPETQNLIKSIADMEKNLQNSTKGSSVVSRKNSNRVKPSKNDDEDSSSNGRHRHHRHSNHHHHQRRRRRSYSTCSTCSSRSRDGYYTDSSYSERRKQQNSEPIAKTKKPQTRKTRTPSPLNTNRSSHHSYKTGSKKTKNSGVTADVEDVPNVRDDRLEQIPIVRRTIIVEPYPSQPNSQIIVKPNSYTEGSTRLGQNQIRTEYDAFASTALQKNAPKKKKKSTEKNDKMTEDIRLEDVNDHDEYSEKSNKKSKKQKSTKTKPISSGPNAFYN